MGVGVGGRGEDLSPEVYCNRGVAPHQGFAVTKKVVCHQGLALM